MEEKQDKIVTTTDLTAINSKCTSRQVTPSPQSFRLIVLDLWYPRNHPSNCICQKQPTCSHILVCNYAAVRNNTAVRNYAAPVRNNATPVRNNEQGTWKIHHVGEERKGKKKRERCNLGQDTVGLIELARATSSLGEIEKGGREACIYTEEWGAAK